jgi:FtsP/CotA-like multicopper oxidase with cupredoxin domain
LRVMCQLVVINITNPTMMAHPMHLHGHHFQVTSVDGSDLAGAVRDTVLVPTMGSVRIAFDANNLDGGLSIPTIFTTWSPA